MIVDVCAPPCFASIRSICSGRSRTCVEGRVVNQIKVDADVAAQARVALNRMLEISAAK
jgi:quinolinate synthase